MRGTCPRFFRSLANRVLPLLAFLLFPAIVALPLEAAEPSSRNLDSGWQFRAVGNTDKPGMTEWRPAQVPGVVHTDLLRNGLIPDPFDRDNEFRLQWIGQTDWEYQTTFQVDSAALGHDHVDLVFDGLDTFADVYLNDQAILSTDNMFRRWRVPAKALLKPGANTLRIAFHSAVEKMVPYVKSLPYVLPSISTNNFGNEDNIATAPYTRKAPYQYGWDWGPRFLTEGIWRPIRLETWDALRIENFHIHQQKITADIASITAEVEIEASRPTTATITLAHDEMSATRTADVTQTLQLDAGINHVSFPIRIVNPETVVPGWLRTTKSLSLFRLNSCWSRSRSSRGSENRTTFPRITPRFGSMGKEFRVCIEWYSRVRQRCRCYSVRQFSQPCDRGRPSQDSRGRSRRAHEYGA